eukprot:3612604-Prymnesium_polylepis.3
MVRSQPCRSLESILFPFCDSDEPLRGAIGERAAGALGEADSALSGAGPAYHVASGPHFGGAAGRAQVAPRGSDQHGERPDGAHARRGASRGDRGAGCRIRAACGQRAAAGSARRHDTRRGGSVQPGRRARAAAVRRDELQGAQAARTHPLERIQRRRRGGTALRDAYRTASRICRAERECAHWR